MSNAYTYTCVHTTCMYYMYIVYYNVCFKMTAKSAKLLLLGKFREQHNSANILLAMYTYACTSSTKCYIPHSVLYPFTKMVKGRQN